MYPIPLPPSISLPSQHQPQPHPVPLPSQPPLGHTLEQRKQSHHKRCLQRVTASRNPIVDSPQYQAYRAKQNHDGGSAKDTKWPDVLELAFLDESVGLGGLEDCNMKQMVWK
ncbi:hypothetical protein ACMFMF_004269 [Clarireedia jacksonii]